MFSMPSFLGQNKLFEHNTIYVNRGNKKVAYVEIIYAVIFYFPDGEN
jgi:hypothetical protein